MIIDSLANMAWRLHYYQIKSKMEDAMKVYQQLARTVDALNNCRKANNTEWIEKHIGALNKVIHDHMPRGSGLDSETTIDNEKSNDGRLILYSSYHCMNENGYYDGWVDFTLTVKPSLGFAFDLRIVGNFGKYGFLKDYLYDAFNTAFKEETE